MKHRNSCDRCGYMVRVKLVQVRRVFGVHRGTRPVFAAVAVPRCGVCRAATDGKWRYAGK